MQSLATPYTDGAAKRRARRGLAIFFAVVVALSLPIQAVIIGANLDGGADGLVEWLALVGALMFVPSIAATVARLAMREGFADVSFRLGRSGRAAIGRALVFPIFIGLIVYGSAWTTGLVGFAAPPLGQWIAGIVVMLILNAVLVSGEEIGWRGYMLLRLIDAGVPRPLLASAMIWGAWHLPLVIWAGFGDGPSPLLSAVLLLGVTAGIGYLLARKRLETGSIWPAVALHAAWNAIIQVGFDPATVGTAKALWVGETGVLTMLALLIAAALYSRKGWELVRLPLKRERAQATQASVQTQPGPSPLARRNAA